MIEFIGYMLAISLAALIIMAFGALSAIAMNKLTDFISGRHS